MIPFTKLLLLFIDCTNLILPGWAIYNLYLFLQPFDQDYQPMIPPTEGRYVTLRHLGQLSKMSRSAKFS